MINSQATQQHWDAVVAAGLMGVNARAITTERADPAIADYLDDTAAPSTMVLTTAALMATAARATVEPVADVLVVEPAPIDPRPQMSHLATQLVVRGVEFGGALSDWVCRRVVASGCAPSAAVLPVLIAKSAVGGSVAEAISQIVGDAGRWLSAYTPELGGRLVTVSTPADDAEVLADDAAWTHGTLDQRVTYLRALRRASPQDGVELLSSTWRGDTGDERERLIGTLAIGVAPDDEPFLDRALDDRRKGVRTLSAHLLATRPDSALLARLTDLLFTIITESPRRFGRRLTVNRDVELPESLVRDGISLTPPGGTARFDHVLRQLIGAVDLGEWKRRFGAEPAAILSALPSDYPSLFVDAIERQGNREWARAVVAHTTLTPGVAALLDADTLVPLATDELTALTRTSTLPALGALPTPWPDAIATHVVAVVRHAAHQRNPINQPIATVLQLIRVGLPVDDATAESSGRWVAELNDVKQVATTWGWPNQLALCIEALLIRSALTRELP